MFKKAVSPNLSAAILMMVAVIWGGGFIVTDSAMRSGLSPSLLLALRFAIPAIIFGFICRKQLKLVTRRELGYSLIVGVFLFLAFVAQTYGIAATTPANCAFLTATNVVMVPFLAWATTGQFPGKKAIILAPVCFLGMVILSYDGQLGISFNRGDWLTLLCAFLFTCHVCLLGRPVAITSATTLSFIQFAVAAVLSLALFLIYELPTQQEVHLPDATLAVIYLGLFSTGLCFFLQTWAQRRLSASTVAIILSSEGLFGGILSVAFGRDELSWQLVCGGTIILVSILLIQLDLKDLARAIRARAG